MESGVCALAASKEVFLNCEGWSFVGRVVIFTTMVDGLSNS